MVQFNMRLSFVLSRGKSKINLLQRGVFFCGWAAVVATRDSLTIPGMKKADKVVPCRKQGAPFVSELKEGERTYHGEGHRLDRTPAARLL